MNFGPTKLNFLSTEPAYAAAADQIELCWCGHSSSSSSSSSSCLWIVGEELFVRLNCRVSMEWPQIDICSICIVAQAGSACVQGDNIAAALLQFCLHWVCFEMLC